MRDRDWNIKRTRISYLFSSTFRRVELHYEFDSPARCETSSQSIVLSARGRNATSSALSVTRLRAIPRSRLGRRIDSYLPSRDRFAPRNIFHGFLSIPQPSIRRLFAVARAAEKCEQRNRRARALSKLFRPRWKLTFFVFIIFPFTFRLQCADTSRYKLCSNDINRSG